MFEKKEDLLNHSDDELIEFYSMFKKEFDDLEEKIKILKEVFADRLHERKVNELILNNDNESWKINYQTTSRKNVNYTMLMETVGQNKYNEIVIDKKSTFLIIKKAGKKTKNSNISNAPIQQEIIEPLIGNLS